MNLFLLHGGEPGIRPLLERLSLPSGTRFPEGEASCDVFRWGAHAQDPAGRHVLNPLRCVLRAIHKNTMRELLAISGVRTEEDGPGEDGYAHEFIVPVFHLQPLALMVRQRREHLLLRGTSGHEAAGEFRETPLPPHSFHGQRAVRQAVRAVYALGLDFASVRVGITPRGRTLVADVDPEPPLNDRLADLLAEALHSYAREREQEEARRKPAVLGADPEFVLRGPDGRIVPASRFLAPDGRAGSDAVRLRDGSAPRPLAELRPAPSADPLRLCAHLRGAMRDADRAIAQPELAWLAGGLPALGLPLGGHIHFSGMWLSSRFLRALDNYLALPLALLESADSRRRRPRYGFLGDFRRKPHGFEYRTPPSWIGTPERAAGVLCLTRVVADHYRELTHTPLQAAEGLRHFYWGEKEKLRPTVEKLWAELERTWSYAAYRRPLERLKADCLALAEWREDEDFKPYWRLEKVSLGQKERPFVHFML